MSRQQLDQLAARYYQLENQQNNVLKENESVIAEFNKAEDMHYSLVKQRITAEKNSKNLNSQLAVTKKNYQELSDEIDGRKAIINKINQMLSKYNEYIPPTEDNSLASIPLEHQLNIEVNAELSGRIAETNNGH